MTGFFLVGAGGALGSMLRYAVSLIANKQFPSSTLIVNIIGCFFIGILAGMLVKNNVTLYSWKFLAIGLCGGFTTFSALSLEGFEMLQQQRYFAFWAYLLLSISMGLGATFLGYLITK